VIGELEIDSDTERVGDGVHALSSSARWGIDEGARRAVGRLSTNVSGQDTSVRRRVANRCTRCRLPHSADEHQRRLWLRLRSR
jgi:hypothetical protein